MTAQNDTSLVVQYIIGLYTRSAFARPDIRPPRALLRYEINHRLWTRSHPGTWLIDLEIGDQEALSLSDIPWSTALAEYHTHGVPYCNLHGSRGLLPTPSCILGDDDAEVADVARGANVLENQSQYIDECNA